MTVPCLPFDLRPRRRIRPLAAALAAALLLATLVSCKGKQQAAPPQPVEVTVMEAAGTTAPVTVDGIGHVFALRTVSIRPQVSGIITKTLFAEGDVVKDGQSLIEIYTDPFKAQLDQAVSTLKRDRATAAQAKRDWLRFKDLVAVAVVSQEDYEQKRTAYQQAAEQVKVDEAAVATAQINLQYCYINSPCTGVVGLQQFKTGNLVTANQDVIVTVNQIEPINVQFSVAEKYLPDIRAHAAKATLALDARYPGSQQTAATGKLTVINNTVDTTTGMITLQGEFANKEHTLWPGQYVEMSLVLATTENTILVPSSAVTDTQDGVSAFIAKPDNTVEIRPITAGRKIGPSTVVEKGISPGEKVITSGQIKLFPGMPIKIVTGEEYKAGPVPPAAVSGKESQGGKAPGEGQGN